MTPITDLLTPSLSRILALTLLHFLWQGALIAFLLAAVNALLHRRSAGSRYAAACAALVAMLALPVVTAGQLAGRGGVPGPAGVFAEAYPPASAGVAVERPALSIDPMTRLAPWVVATWLTGVGALSVRFLGGWILTARLKRRHTRAVPAAWRERFLELAARLRVSQPVRLFESALVEVPTALGILRPVVLLPAGLATGLTAPQLDSLLAHELAHVRRRDCLVNLVQALAETVLFYHPAVWWVSQRIRIERENACDDLAVAATGDAAAYARALVALEERRDAAPRLAVAADGGRLWNRISRLFPPAETEGARAPRWLAATLALGGVLALGAVAHVPETVVTTPASASLPAAPSASPAPTTAQAAQPAPTKLRTEARSKVEPDSRPDAETDPDDLPLPAAGGMLSPQQLIAFRIHDVSPEFIGQIRALGYDKASANELVALRIHGVTPEYIRAMTPVFGKRPLEDYTAFKIHGLTPEALKALEAVFGKLTSDDALAMRIHGVDAAFVQAFRDAGYAPLSADEAVALKIHGVAPADAAAWKSLGFATPSVDDLLALRIHGVTPEQVRSLRALGLSNLSLEDAVAFRIHGVSPEFVKEIRALGYTSLDADELTSFRIHGVTPEYIRKMNGKLGGTLSTDELLSLRIHGREGRDE